MVLSVLEVISWDVGLLEVALDPGGRDRRAGAPFGAGDGRGRGSGERHAARSNDRSGHWRRSRHAARTRHRDRLRLRLRDRRTCNTGNHSLTDRQKKPLGVGS